MAKGKRNNNRHAVKLEASSPSSCQPPRPTLNSNAIEELQAHVTPVKNEIASPNKSIYKKEVSNTDSGVFEETNSSSGTGSPEKLTPNLRINNKKFDLDELDLVTEDFKEVVLSEDTDIEVASSDDAEDGLELEDLEEETTEDLRDPATMMLHTPWTMYFVTKSKGGKIKMEDYKDGRQPYPMISTVADFWMQLNNIPLPKELRVANRDDLYFFRENIQPEWEDPQNTGGGMWRLELTSKEHRNSLINILWYELLLALIGEQFTDAQLINGCIFQRRQKEDRIQLWTRSLTGKDDIKKRMAGEFRSFLRIEVELQYISHAENRAAQSSANWSSNGKGGNGARASKSQGHHKSKHHSNTNGPQAGSITLMKRGSCSTIEPLYMNAK